MALTKEQAAWLQNIGQAGVLAVKDAARRNKKADALKDASAALDAHRDTIREGFQQIRVEMEPEGFLQTLQATLLRINPSRPMLDPESDAMREYDIGADLDRSLPKGDDMAKMQNLLGPIAEQAALLKDATDEDGNPLFDPEDPVALAKAFYEPLVREGIIPENLVIDKYSEVSRTMTGSLALYQERLEEYSKGLTQGEKVLEYFDLPVTLTTSALKIASSAELMRGGIEAYGAGVASLDALKESKNFKEVEKATAIIDGVAACLSSSKKAADAIIKKSDLQGAADVLISAVGKILTPTLGKETAGMITRIATAASHAAPIVQAAAKEDMSAMLKQIGAAIGDSLAASSPDPVFKEIGEVIKLQFEALAKIAEGGKDNADAYSKIMQAAVTVGSGAGQLIAGKLKDRALKELATKDLPAQKAKEEKDAINTLFGAIESGTKFAGSQGEQGIEMSVTLKSLSEKANQSVDKALVDELSKKAVAAQEEEMRALLSAPDKDFQKVLTIGFLQDDEDPASRGITEEMRIKSLETLIAEVQRQQKIYDFAKAIATGGFASIEKFVPGLNIAAAGTKTIFAFGEALQKSRQLLVWFQNQKDAKVAVTVQYDVMMNRFGLQSEQAVAAGMQFLIAAIDTVGKAMQVAGHLAPIGVAVSAGATASEAALTAALSVTTKIKMAAAWAIYKEALENPSNRRKAREALQTNPTLAKYAMFWGAKEDDNRIAQAALDSCGIDEVSLATPGADSAKVVKYLETYFRDDPKLLREVPQAAVWFPGEIELTVGSWVAFHQAAEDKAKFKDRTSGDVTGRLHELNAQLQVLSEVRSDDLQEKVQQTEYAIRESESLIAVLERYKPVDKNDEPHESMVAYVKAVTEKTRSQLAALKTGLEQTQRELAAV